MVTMDEAIQLLRAMRRDYGRLHDILSDMIEGQRLLECDCPDDYAALVDALNTCVNVEHQVVQFLNDAGVPDE